MRSKPHQQCGIAIADGYIVAIDGEISTSDEKEIDAGGNLVAESFVNSHLHLCKVYTLLKMDEWALKDYQATGMCKAMTAIELAARVKKNYEQSWIIKNVRKVVALMYRA